MSRYREAELEKIKTQPIKKRYSKIDVDAFAGAVSPEMANILDALPDILAGRSLRKSIEATALAARSSNPVVAMIVMGLASFSNDLLMPAAWATCIDVGGRHAGTLSGSMDMMGNLIAGVAAVSVGYLLDLSGGNWSLVFYIGSAMYLGSAVCWYFLRSASRLESTPGQT